MPLLRPVTPKAHVTWPYCLICPAIRLPRNPFINARGPGPSPAEVRAHSPQHLALRLHPGLDPRGASNKRGPRSELQRPVGRCRSGTNTSRIDFGNGQLYSTPRKGVRCGFIAKMWKLPDRYSYKLSSHARVWTSNPRTTTCDPASVLAWSSKDG